MKTKIEWCDEVANTGWGCLRNCNYCYARKFARRIGRFIGENRGYSEEIIQKMINFQPVFFPDYDRIIHEVCKNIKPKRIFMNSMSGIEYLQPECVNRTLEKIKQYQQHTFLFLTKGYRIYDMYNFPDNCWLGVTITTQYEMTLFAYSRFPFLRTRYDDINKMFISIEPIQEEIKLYVTPDWLIIGAETGNRKEKIIPEKSWIANLLLQADKYNIPVFMKDNLKSVWGNELIQEFPE